MKLSRLKLLLERFPDDAEVKIAACGQSDYDILSVYEVPGIVWLDIILPDGPEVPPCALYCASVRDMWRMEYCGASKTVRWSAVLPAPEKRIERIMERFSKSIAYLANKW